jgi:hypothetical protein
VDSHDLAHGVCSFRVGLAEPLRGPACRHLAAGGADVFPPLILLAAACLSGGFETPEERAAVTLEGEAQWMAPLEWQRVQVSVPAGNARRVTLLVEAQPHGGVVWIDGVEASVPVRDASFEGSERSGWESSQGTRLEVLPYGPDGTQAARLVATEGQDGVLSVRQSLSCEPLTAVSASVLVATESPDDGVTITLKAEGPGGAQSSNSASGLRHTPSRVGSWVLQLRPGARATLPSREAVRAPLVTLDLRGSPGARARLALRDAAGTELAATEVEAPRNWSRFRALRVRLAEAMPVDLRVEAIDGMIEFDNVRVSPLAPLVDDGIPDAEIVYRAAGPVVVRLDEGVSNPSTLTPLRAFAAELMMGRTGEGDPIEVPLSLDPELPEEGYAVDRTEDSLAISAGGPRGARYALLSLAELVTPEVGESGQALLCGSSRGEPAFPFRGALLMHGEGGEGLALASSLRLNHACFEPDEGQSVGEELEAASALAVAAQATDIEPVPLLRLWGASLLGEQPLLAEGTEIDETVELDADGRAMLSHSVALIGTGRPLTVSSADDGRVYVEGRDYSVQAGELVFLPDEGFPADSEPWFVERLDGGAMKPGERVVLSYDAAVAGDPSLPVCPGRAQLGAAAFDLVERLRANTGCRWIRLDLGTALAAGTDEPCVSSGRSAEWLLRLRLRELGLMVQTSGLPLRFLLPARWAELGERADASPPFGGLPSCFVLLIEAGRATPSDFAALLDRLRAAPERQWVVAVGDSPEALAAWTEVATRCRRDGMGCLGLLAIPASGRPAPVGEVALATWNGATPEAATR